MSRFAGPSRFIEANPWLQEVLLAGIDGSCDAAFRALFTKRLMEGFGTHIRADRSRCCRP